MNIGYARTSTVDQMAGFDAQLRDLKAAGCEKVFSEQISAASDRDKLEAALDFVREGDTLFVTKPDRLARSTADMLRIGARLEAKGGALVVLSMGGEQVDTRTAMGRLMLTLLGAIAMFERDLMLERQREGIAKAKAEGKYKGRAPTALRKADSVRAMLAEGVGPSEVARKLGISRTSVFRITNGAT